MARWKTTLAISLASCGPPDHGGLTADESEASSQVLVTDPTAPPNPDLGSLDLGTPECGLNNGELGLSFIWIANSTQGTVSKIDSLIAANSGEYGGIRRVG